VKAHPDDSKTMAELLQKMNKVEGMEGMVLMFRNGLMYKVKTSWYLSTGAGTSDLICQEKDIWKYILDETIDDYKSQGVKKVLRNRIDKFTKELYHQIHLTAEDLSQKMDKLSQQHPTKPEKIAAIKQFPAGFVFLFLFLLVLSDLKQQSNKKCCH
jgi:intein-encoded DNA endonuclease-like protein